MHSRCLEELRAELTKDARGTQAKASPPAQPKALLHPAGLTQAARAPEERPPNPPEKLAAQGLNPPTAPPGPANNDVSVRLAKLRLDVCALSQARAVSEQESSLVGIALQCQALAGYFRVAGFPALAQISSGVEGLVREICERSVRVTDAIVRTLSEALDLLNLLGNCAPESAGRAEGARVLVMDETAGTRLSTLAVLERVGITAVGMASLETALGVLNENPVDVILVRTDTVTSLAPRLCQAIRQIRGHARTPVVVHLPNGTSERSAVLALSGATEVITGPVLGVELGLKILGHFFRGRVSGE